MKHGATRRNNDAQRTYQQSTPIISHTTAESNEKETATKQRCRTTTQQVPPETTTTKHHTITRHEAMSHNGTPQDAPPRHITFDDEAQHQTNCNATHKTGHHETRNPIHTHNDTKHNNATQKTTQPGEPTRYQHEARYITTHYNPTPLRTT